MRCITFNNETNYIRLFTRLPKRLYTKKECMQNSKEEIELLKGEHRLSSYFTTRGFLVLDEKQRPLARAMVTLYPKEDIAYVGFFESINDAKVSHLLFEEINKYCSNQKRKQIIGPVDASFWIKYRLKINAFNPPYTGEPYNKAYYLELFEREGYMIKERYVSNYFPVIDKAYDNEKYLRRLEDKIKAGYEIKSPTKEDFESILSVIYKLLIELYCHFPAYKYIREEEFTTMFSYFSKIVDYEMVKVAYFKQEPVGFFIGIPDYGTAVYGKITPIKLVKILALKKKPKAYIMLYMGVEKEHLGLGSALTEVMKQALQKKQVPAVGALIHKGKVTGAYYNELIQSRYEYVLLEKWV